MSMNIKSEEAHRVARELAALTGESVTAAVTVALRERLSRVKVEQAGGLAERLVQIGREAAAHMKEPFLSTEHGELLYDEQGLPIDHR